LAAAACPLTRKVETAVLHRSKGFTLLESAIVVVTLGFLMVGVLKGQELIQSARVHALIAQHDGIKVNNAKQPSDRSGQSSAGSSGSGSD
jgi:Prokaryotic N-terminal methylation motif